MRSALVLFSLLISISSLSTALAAQKTAAKKVPPPPDYFPLASNHWWKYQTIAPTGNSGFELKVIDVQKKADGTVVYDLHTTPQSASTMAAAGFDEWYEKPKGWVITTHFQFGGKNSDYAPPRKYLENPLKIGDTWTWSGTKQGVAVTENNRVDSAEEIEVPAGKFKTMRVSADVHQGGTSVTKTYWYSPWVGLVQSKTQSGGIESTAQLVDYSFKKREAE